MDKIILIIIFATISTILFLSSITYSPVTRDYSIKNNLWNGLSSLVEKIRDSYELIILNSSLTNLNISPGETCILIISPTINYSPDEIKFIKNFLSNGGTIIILDDFGGSNDVLRKLSCPISFTGKPLLDNALYSKQPIFPTIVGIRMDGKTYSNITLLLNIPTAINVSSHGKWDINVLATSSEYSFIDDNLNFKRDSDEKYGCYPIIVEATRNSGRIIAISDPSILINSMIDKYDNGKLIKMFLNKYGIKKVVLDIAHRERSLLENVKYIFLGFETTLSILINDLLIQYILTIFISIIILSISYRLLKMIVYE